MTVSTYVATGGLINGRTINQVLPISFLADPKQPFTEDDLAGVGYTLHGRSHNAILTDSSKKAPVTRDVRKWASKPNRLDLGGVDRPGAMDHHLAARIDILKILLAERTRSERLIAIDSH